MIKELSTKKVIIRIKPSEFKELQKEQKQFGFKAFSQYIKKILSRRSELFEEKKTI